jgi:hypothetical protein
MSLISRTENQRTLLEQTIAGPNNGVTYTDAIVSIRPNFELDSRKVSIAFKVSAAVATAARVNLYGSFTPAGEKVLISAAIGGDSAPATTLRYVTVDLNALPMPYYYVGLASAVDDSAKNLSVYISE